MFGVLLDLALGAVNIVDDVAQEATGIRPVEDTVTAAAVVTCAVCAQKPCKCKSQKVRQ